MSTRRTATTKMPCPRCGVEFDVELTIDSLINSSGDVVVVALARQDHSCERPVAA